MPATLTPLNPLYTGISLAQARTKLSSDLLDTTNAFWSVSELNMYIQEAIRTFQSLTGFYKVRIQFTTTPSEPFYDLYELAPGYAPTIPDTFILQNIQASLLEPITGINWTGGSEQFNYAQVVSAMQDSINKFMLSTAAYQSRSLINAPPPPVSQAVLPTTLITILRLAWVTPDGIISPIFRDSDYSTQSFAPLWPNSPSVPPITYSVSSTSPNMIQLAPPASEPGLFDLIYIDSNPLDPTAGKGLHIPDCYAYAIKWGALHTLLSTDSISKDPHRAAYCLTRYQELTELATHFPSIIQASINGKQVYVAATQNFDTYRPGWQYLSSTPMMLSASGRNLISTDCSPNDIYSLSLDVLGNVPMPVADTDFLQINSSWIEAVLGYAHHLACFKQGGADFDHTIPLYKQILAVATIVNAQLSAMNFYRHAMHLPAQRQGAEVARQTRSAKPITEEGT